VEQAHFMDQAIGHILRRALDDCRDLRASWTWCSGTLEKHWTKCILVVGDHVLKMAVYDLSQ